MNRVLFVDDEPRVLHGLRRMLGAAPEQWHTAFAESAAEALAALACNAFDVIVTDIRMPDTDGVQLLKEVKERYPDLARIVLSGQSQEETTLRTIGLAHQYLSKPCAAKTLIDTLSRVLAIRELLRDAHLQRLVARMPSLPSLPTLYVKLQEKLQAPDPSISDIAGIISRDLGMTAKVLQLVNSAFFGLYQPVSSVEHAVRLLGLRTVTSLVLTVEAFSLLSQDIVAAFRIENLMAHSLRVGALAGRIARTETREQHLSVDALTTGMLHDAGRLILAANLPTEYMHVAEMALDRDVPGWQVEQEFFGTTHAEIGAFLLGLWGLPDAVIEGVAFHHRPDQCVNQEFSALSAVHIADYLDHEEDGGELFATCPALADGYVASLGLTEQLHVWRKICDSAELERDETCSTRFSA